MYIVACTHVHVYTLYIIHVPLELFLPGHHSQVEGPTHTIPIAHVCKT